MQQDTLGITKAWNVSQRKSLLWNTVINNTGKLQIMISIFVLLLTDCPVTCSLFFIVLYWNFSPARETKNKENPVLSKFTVSWPVQRWSTCHYGVYLNWQRTLCISVIPAKGDPFPKQSIQSLFHQSRELPAEHDMDCFLNFHPCLLSRALSPQLLDMGQLLWGSGGLLH